MAISAWFMVDILYVYNSLFMGFKNQQQNVTRIGAAPCNGGHQQVGAKPLAFP